MRRGDAATRRRGEEDGARLTPADGPRCLSVAASGTRGFTLIELVVTITVMAVLALGAIPLVKTAVRRQKEQQLRESLRVMREAIKEFRRDTVGMQCAGGLPGAPGGGEAPITPPPQPGAPGAPGAPQQQPGGPLVDPRTTVVIADCTIFTVDNPDRYPPDLETLVGGVNVLPRQASAEQQLGSVSGNFLDRQEGGALAFKKKVYLRAVPVDPMTGKADWVTCSSWEDQRGESCNGTENVFDVRSRSQETALNGRDKYSDW
jgi:prepilin-type N-terminal cleavage/methylation domain-containing protein